MTPEDARWIWRFGDKSLKEQLSKAIQDFKFRATLKPRIDAEVRRWHEAQPPDMPPPVITHHPVDPELQPGESAGLGGAMEINAPWKRD